MRHLTVLFGSGATIHCGAPATPDLTHAIRHSSISVQRPKGFSITGPYGNNIVPIPLYEQLPVCDSIFRALQSDFESPNFEHILAALEALETLALSKNNYSVPDQFKHVLAPFVQVDRRHELLAEPAVVSSTHTALIQLISEQIGAGIDNQRAAGKDPVADTSDLISALRQSFDLSVFTLNYDDIVDDAAADWYDGFTIAGSQPGAHSQYFNRREFNSWTGPNLLVHMHGSVRFGYGGIEQRIVKFESVKEAQKTLGSPPWNANDQGVNVSAAPIVSGFNKVAKLNQSTAPYGYYYRAFVDALLACPNLLIIGYGGNDQYVNAWLDEFIKIHEDGRRVVYVDKCAGGKDKVGNNKHPVRRIMRAFADGDFNDSMVFFDPDRLFMQPHEFQPQGPNLVTCFGGFPFYDSETLTKLIEYFSSNLVR